MKKNLINKINKNNYYLLFLISFFVFFIIKNSFHFYEKFLTEKQKEDKRIEYLRKYVRSLFIGEKPSTCTAVKYKGSRGTCVNVNETVRQYGLELSEEKNIYCNALYNSNTQRKRKCKSIKNFRVKMLSNTLTTRDKVSVYYKIWDLLVNRIYPEIKNEYVEKLNYKNTLPSDEIKAFAQIKEGILAYKEDIENRLNNNIQTINSKIENEYNVKKASIITKSNEITAKENEISDAVKSGNSMVEELNLDLNKLNREKQTLIHENNINRININNLIFNANTLREECLLFSNDCSEVPSPIPPPTAPLIVKTQTKTKKLENISKGLSDGAIVGIVIGSIAGIAFLLGGFFIYRKRVRSIKKPT